MSELAIDKNSLQNGIFRDGQIVFGQTTGNCSIYSNGVGSIAYGYVDGNSANPTNAIIVNSSGAYAGGYISAGSGNNKIIASAPGAHAEGYAYGGHVEATGWGSHAEGQNTKAQSTGAHAEGISTIAQATAAHAEGQNTKATNNGAHAEGYALGNANMYYNVISPSGVTFIIIDTSTSSEKYIYANTTNNIKFENNHILVQGDEIKVIQGERNQEVVINEIISNSSDNRTELRTRNLTLNAGSCTIQYKQPSINEYNIASGIGSHVEGKGTSASGTASHAEGQETEASGIASHAEGRDSSANGYYAHAEGYQTTASGTASHAGGIGTIANQEAMTAIGKYNSLNTEMYGDDTLFVIGNGNSTTRKNVLNINNDGSIYFNNNYVYFNKFETDNNYIKSNTYSLDINANNELILYADEKVTINSDQVTINSYTKISNTVTATVNGVSDVYLGCPIGTIVMWAGTSLNKPIGWLLCNGNSYDAVTNTQYQNLYNVIGNEYGGTSNTNFKVPHIVITDGPLCNVRFIIKYL